MNAPCSRRRPDRFLWSKSGGDGFAHISRQDLAPCRFDFLSDDEPAGVERLGRQAAGDRVVIGDDDPVQPLPLCRRQELFGRW